MTPPMDEKTPRKLLVVDDEEKICHLMREYFSQKGFEVRAVCRGDEAVALATVFQPDVVILDLLMPGLNGAETLKQLKSMQRIPKVIMFSAADHEDVSRGALALGADFYVCKPADLRQIEILINSVCPPSHS